MIELSPACYHQIFPGCNSGSFSGTKEELFEFNPGIIIYGKEYGQWRFLTEWDLSSWISCKNTDYIREIEKMKNDITSIEIELHDLKRNTIKIDEADFAYLLLKYKE